MKIALLLFIGILAVFFIGCDTLKSEEQLAKEIIECAIESGDSDSIAVVALLGGLDQAAEVLALEGTKKELIKERNQTCD